MYIVFVEYRIEPQALELYAAWAEHMKLREPRLQLFEGTDQPGLFVELWSDLAEEAYVRMKQMRTGTEELEPTSEDTQLWRELERWVVGGRAKIHIWRFVSK
ncbi:hypothetical protein [Paenibacillus sp. YYML68]|uniref:hypothetical protein n=1 Tax=Paenibacillus sp. YYML68 TaxID=2909250 RepID=UPI0024916E7E|nr:hypothetical protein [Paenibacillus sp. YYML68]